MKMFLKQLGLTFVIGLGIMIFALASDPWVALLAGFPSLMLLSYVCQQTLRVNAVLSGARKLVASCEALVENVTKIQ